MTSYTQIMFKTCTALLISSLLIQCSSPGLNNTTIEIKNPLSKDTSYVESVLRKSAKVDDSITHINLLKRALTKSLESNYNDGVVSSICAITSFFLDHGMFDSCLTYYDLAYPYLSHPNYRKDLPATFYLNYGAYFHLKGEYLSADSLYYLALKATMEDSSLALKRIPILYNLNFTKQVIGQRQQAFAYLEQAKILAATFNDTANLRTVYTAESDFFLDEGRLQKAEESIIKSFCIYKSDTTIDQLNIYASILAAGDKTKEAIHVYKLAIEKSVHEKIDHSHMSLLLQLGLLYDKLGNYLKAEQALRSAENILISKKFYFNAVNIYGAMSLVFKHEGKYLDALEAEKKRSTINDSLVNLEKIQNLNELQLKYQTSEKDKLLAVNKLKIAVQGRKISRQNLLIIIISLSGIFLLLSLLGFYRLKKHQVISLKQEQEIISLKSKIQGEENERERLARDLHDGLGGLLTTLARQTSLLENEFPGLTTSKTLQHIKTTLLTTNMDLKKTSNNLMADPVEKLGLSEAICQFCSNIIPAEVQFKFNTYGNLNDLPASFQLAIYRIVQELINNAVKYANGNMIFLQLGCLMNMIEVVVEDNGGGINGDIKKQGFGFTNLKHRIKDLKGSFAVNTSPGHGTSVNVEIPIL